MFDRNVTFKMSSCHDPYKELELYLEQAQEEIGRAVRELECFGVDSPGSDAALLSDNYKNDGILSPPLSTVNDDNYSLCTVNSSNKVHLTNKLNSLKTSYFSTLNPQTLEKINRTAYSPKTRRKLWQMHPSISFPETEKDLLLLGKDLEFSESASDQTCGTNVYPCECKSLALKLSPERTLLRSISDASIYHALPDNSKNAFMTPKPSSGDFKLPSPWTNNLILGKAFPEEDFASEGSSPTKNVSPIQLESDNIVLNCGSQPVLETHFMDMTPVSHSNCNEDLISKDSEMKELHCVISDHVDSPCFGGATEENSDIHIPLHELITPPPPEFSDDRNPFDKALFECIDSAALNNEIKSNHRALYAAVSMFEIQETSEVFHCPVQNFESVAHVIAPKILEFEDFSISQTTCSLNDASRPLDDSIGQFCNLGGRVSNSLNSDQKYGTISCMTTLDSKNDNLSLTLPRSSNKDLEVTSFQRSVSHSSVSAVDPMNINELVSWMRKIKSCTPACADIAVDAKENQDAVTQTTPLTLSRSSSLTWVTDCTYSDWEANNLNSGSEESCSNCKRERKYQKSSSSSSLEISSDDEDYVPATPGSSNSSSSLYLSACSGSSDSFEEASFVIKETEPSTEYDLVQSSFKTFRSCETSPLGDINEEQIANDSLSISNPVISFCKEDPLEQSASFPSTLKVMKKSKSPVCPTQPFEQTVLIINELNLKSASAPVLLKQKRRLPGSKKFTESSSSTSSIFSDGKNHSIHYESQQVPARSQSAKELNELQAIEACSWLRAAGFPQYAQMYEDNQFPVDISVVQKDHAFLPPDSMQSLFRRLNTLNRCANKKFIDHGTRKSLHMEDSDEEEHYALSENWEFQCSSRRWSRITAVSDGIAEFVITDHSKYINPSSKCSTFHERKYLSPEEAYCSSHDSVFGEEQHSSPDSVRRTSVLKADKISKSPSHTADCSPGSSSGSGGTLSLFPDDMLERRRLRRSGSDRVKEGAKALLKRMESLKVKRKKKGRDSVKVEKASSGTDGSSSSSLASSPQFRRSQKLKNNLPNTNLFGNHKKGVATHSKNDNTNSHSDSECNMTLVLDKRKDANSTHTKQFLSTHATFALTCTQSKLSLKSNSLDNKVQTDVPTTQFLHPCSSTNQELSLCDKRNSYYDNISAPIVVFNDFCDESTDRSSVQLYGDESHFSLHDKDLSQNEENDEIIIINSERRDSGFGSSLTRGITCVHAPWHCFPSSSVSEVKSIVYPVKINDLLASQILLLRKLSLLKLTAMMERFSPSNRTGWNWGVPKFIRRIRNPDYKDKNVFGVPLLLILQRTGQPLPAPIQAAFHYLRETALESTGLFRKSGVRSRIQKLKNMSENNPESMVFKEQQAYDVADLIKQYFRELPEALLTNKLSETFINIFQFIPEELRIEAVQAALMLMPDENREVLQVLLEFLSEVCQQSEINQMSATNLAVCFAPSLFHLSSARSASSSPRRCKTVGVPDVKELSENRAAYECLSCMISNYKTLFSVSEEMAAQSRISSATYTQTATIQEISSLIFDGLAGIKGYVDSCIQVFLKEAKEKYKSFLNFSQHDHVEISYKKLSDGHPLRLWKVSTEVEAPPSVLLNRILRERHLWDPSLMKSKIITHLNSNTEVLQYLYSSLPPQSPCDYCVLRSWRTDLPRGACVLIETSVSHPDAEISPGSVRALVLASRYLIEPCGSGKSRITYLSRVDTRGRSPEWYNRAYGNICALLLIKLRASFSHVCNDGPETKL